MSGNETSTGVYSVSPSSSSTGGGNTDSGIVFFSVDAVFLTTLSSIFITIITWTTVATAIMFFGASVYALRTLTNKQTPWYTYIIVPAVASVWGGGLGFIQSAISSALIGATAVSINQSVGIDIAAGLGLGQAIIIIYFHLGRADFIHR